MYISTKFYFHCSDASRILTRVGWTGNFDPPQLCSSSIHSALLMGFETFGASAGHVVLWVFIMTNRLIHLR